MKNIEHPFPRNEPPQDLLQADKTKLKSTKNSKITFMIRLNGKSTLQGKGLSSNGLVYETCETFP